jgi:CspA family cold shock protein
VAAGRDAKPTIVVGTVREWHDDEGWGVLDSPETPGGCWMHYTDIDMTGYRLVTKGQRVAFSYEPASQDGFRWRAVSVRPEGTLPSEPGDSSLTDGHSYRSELALRFDADDI